MAAKKSLNFILPDDQMGAYLEADTSLVFAGLAKHWQDLERQVERLGFGEKYFVSQAKSVRGGVTRVTPVH